MGQPIGIFDSGIGGLTVAKAIAEHMPYENMVYIGDTARSPWGCKSVAAITRFAEQISAILKQHHCKAIVIACNTASACAVEPVKTVAGPKIPVFNVITPTVQYIAESYPSGDIGLIGTKQTILSRSYEKKLAILNSKLRLIGLPTPLLVPLIEEGMIDHPAAQLIVADYLQNQTLANIKSLILGCTHYPLFKPLFRQLLDNNIDIIDSADLVAKNLKHYLTLKKLLNNNSGYAPYRTFYLSDVNAFFTELANCFFDIPSNISNNIKAIKL